MTEIKKSRSPHGERGLKYVGNVKVVGTKGRSPHGERGLKLQECYYTMTNLRVALLTESVD